MLLAFGTRQLVQEWACRFFGGAIEPHHNEAGGVARATDLPAPGDMGHLQSLVPDGDIVAR